MTVTFYTPIPGTIPYKAVNHLRQQKIGTQLSTAELAEAIGVDLDSFSMCMKPAREAGLVLAEHAPGNKRRLYWRLGAGTPLPKPDDYEPDEPLTPTQSRPRKTDILKEAGKVMLGEPRQASQWLATEPIPKLEIPQSIAPAQQTETVRRPFRAGLFTDGTMLVEAGATSMNLTADETQSVRRLLSGDV